MKGRSCLLVAAVGVAIGTGCSESIINPPGDTAELRLTHASSGLGAVDVEIGGEAVIRGVGFGNTSPLVLVPAGSQRLVVRTATQVLGTVDGVLSENHVNSVVVAAGTPQLSAVVEPDTGSTAPSRANLRLVTVATTNTASPTLLNALLNYSGVPADSTARIGGIDATVARYGSLMYFDPGAIRIRYVPAGASSPVLAEANFEIAAGVKKAAVLSRNPDGSYKVEIVVEQ
jgi:hypothetical protein